MGARIPNIRIPNPFENQTFYCSDFECSDFEWLDHSKTEHLNIQNGRFSIAGFTLNILNVLYIKRRILNGPDHSKSELDKMAALA